jgi:hypothetical protein
MRLIDVYTISDRADLLATATAIVSFARPAVGEGQ